jgi:enoyl-CoA hydratase
LSDTLIRVERGVGRITLNRPRALNALTHSMVRDIDAALQAWAGDNAIRFVLVDGAGERGLCAGGDIRALYDAVAARDFSVPASFFRDEYRMNARIARWPKPYVALMDGIVMGGGVGLSAHGTHRVVTERSRVAMPETGIGFVPDVGGTWLLGHAPGELGTHAALTSFQMGADDAILCGLADISVASTTLAELTAALLVCVSAADIQDCLGRFATSPQAGALRGSQGWIDPCYAHKSVEAIVDALQHHAAPAAQHAAEEIGKKSPTSLKITLRALREARLQDRLEPCLEQEYRLAMACMKAPDFREGVRAAVVDKDRNPAWSPARLEDVLPSTIDTMFTPSDGIGLGLEGPLPQRSATAT